MKNQYTVCLDDEFLLPPQKKERNNEQQPKCETATTTPYVVA